MTRRRKALITAFAAALAVQAPAGAAVTPSDQRSPDAADIAPHRAREPQDQRTPDARDAAAGRAIVASVPFEVVNVQTDDGFDWDDAGIGAGGALGLVLVGAGGTVAVVRRRHHRAAIA
jgi:hypothetical protein